MDFSRLNPTGWSSAAIASLLLIVCILFLPWYSLDETRASVWRRRPARTSGSAASTRHSCTGFETFPILRWLLLLAALAPLILAWILVRGHKLSWAPGEMTMVVGVRRRVLIVYNGIIDKPGSGTAEVGLGLDYGYWIALLSAITIAAIGFTRSLESGERKTRKAPGTV